jgi:hypothetical protein
MYIVVVRLIIEDEDRNRKKRLKKLEREAMQMVETLKENILQDIHLFKIDKNIKNIDDAEKVLLNNLLQDFKNVETIISRKIRKAKLPKKEELE